MQLKIQQHGTEVTYKNL